MKQAKLLYVKFKNYEDLVGYINHYDILEKDIIKIDRRGEIIEMVFRNNARALQYSSYTINR